VFVIARENVPGLPTTMVLVVTFIGDQEKLTPLVVDVPDTISVVTKHDNEFDPTIDILGTIVLLITFTIAEFVQVACETMTE